MKADLFSELLKPAWVAPALGGDDLIWLGLVLQRERERALNWEWGIMITKEAPCFIWLPDFFKVLSGTA